MNYLTLENVTKSYGDKVLFEDITLHINAGDKVALVARNGTGKTSLLKVIAGEEGGEGEHCRIDIHKNVRIGYLKQEPVLDPALSVIDTVFSGSNPLFQAIRDYENAMIFQHDNKRMEEAVVQMDLHKAWDFESKAKEILFKLQITDLDQKVGTLSGGQRKRLALARLLIEEPEFLILDEPTNHLDLEMIEWLEDYLRQPGVTLFLITHDRYFLENICNVIVELDRGQLHKYSGNYSEFLHKKTTRHINEQIEKEKAGKLMKKELEWIRRQPKARGTKAKSRVDAFDSIVDKATKDLEEDSVQIDIKGARLGSKILEVQYVSHQFDDLVLLDNFHYKFKKNERVGIVGKNGTGKSTFLNIITKQLKPTSGSVVVGSTVQFGYYAQDGMVLGTDKRVIDVVRDIAEYIPLEKGQKLSARQLCERFMFDAKKQLVYASQLSGGEKRRLYLLTVLMANPNFLILDEPTNDLDIVTLNVLEEFLSAFRGCVVIVSHDRFFMDKVVDHLFVFEGDGHVRDFPGNYSQYREWSKRQKAPVTPQQKEKQNDAVSSSALSYEQKKEIKRLENQIKKHETRRNEIMEEFNSTELTQEQITSLSEELEELNAKIEEKEIRWFELSEME